MTFKYTLGVALAIKAPKFINRYFEKISEHKSLFPSEEYKEAFKRENLKSFKALSSTSDLEIPFLVIIGSVFK